jgi:predicted amidohydrolase
VPSKKRAELHANELLKVAREERDSDAARRTRLLVILFPELSACAPARRRAVVQEARLRAKRDRLVLLSNLAVLLPGAALVAALLMDSKHSSSLVLVAAGTVVLGRYVAYVRTRRWLRSMLESRTHPMSDDSASG